MLFNTPQFAVFFLVVLGLYTLVPRGARQGLLLASSIVFYALWLPAYLLLLLLDVGVNYALLRGIERGVRPRLHLTLSVTFTLGLLATFKYAAMAVTTLAPVLAVAQATPPSVPDIILPLGISFYSFQIIALAVDAHRGAHPPLPGFARYALFVSFFPQLIAGPILRGSELLPQLEHGGVQDIDRSRRGLWLIATGLAKKMILADWLLAPFVDMAFDPHAIGSAPFNWIGLYSFAFQIYFDFSGYCDIARGLACLLGFELPLNFAEPYLSRSPREFWRRWHITLSRWLADYLYIPLGGNRAGACRTQRNLLLTMLLGGLWHGAAWTFVLWGGLHGLLLIVARAFAWSTPDTDAPIGRRDWLRIALLFHLTCIGWVFFRAESAEHAMRFIADLFAGGAPHGWPLVQLCIVLVCVALHPLERWARLRAPSLRAATSRHWTGALLEGALLGALLGAAAMTSGAGGDFIYFQF